MAAVSRDEFLHSFLKLGADEEVRLGCVGGSRCRSSIDPRITILLWMSREKASEHGSKLAKRHLRFLIFAMGAEASTSPVSEPADLWRYLGGLPSGKQAMGE